MRNTLPFQHFKIRASRRDPATGASWNLTKISCVVDETRPLNQYFRLDSPVAVSNVHLPRAVVAATGRSVVTPQVICAYYGYFGVMLG